MSNLEKRRMRSELMALYNFLRRRNGGGLISLLTNGRIIDSENNLHWKGR